MRRDEDLIRKGIKKSKCVKSTFEAQKLHYIKLSSIIIILNPDRFNTLKGFLFIGNSQLSLFIFLKESNRTGPAEIKQFEGKWDWSGRYRIDIDRYRFGADL